MGKILDCNVCGDTATVHLTQIINNQIEKIDLCESCAKVKGISDLESFPPESLLHQVPKSQAPAIVRFHPCTTCGFTAENLKKYGHLGCSQCYTIHGHLILQALQGIHKQTLHKGKTPRRLLARLAAHTTLKTLENQLLSAANEEKFELAAELRDKIRSLKSTPDSINTQ